MEDLCVLKFGGASVATPCDFDRVAKIIKKKSFESKKLIVVVSAMAKATDELIKMAHLVNIDPPKRELDMLVSVGERISIALLAMALQKEGMDAISLTGSQSGIITSNDHTEAKITQIKPKRVNKLLEDNKVVIVAGFQGMSESGEITTLGRGGSDTSAVALAVACGSNKVEFYKDVPGIFDKDPQSFEDAKFLKNLTYDEMIELCLKGAKVLHTRSVLLAKKNHIQLVVKSFLDQELPFTVIEDKEMLHERTLEPIFESSI